MSENRYAIYAKRRDEKNWSDWCRVSTLTKAEEHFERVQELGYEAKIYDTKNKKVIAKYENYRLN